MAMAGTDTDCNT